MATKPIPAGTVNLSVNIRKDVRDEIGRHCYRLNRSIGDWARELFNRGLAAAKSAICFRTEARLAAEEDRMAAKLLRRAIATKGGIGPEDAEDILHALEYVGRSAARDERISNAPAA